MQYPVLLITDLHLTSKPDDEYRWGLFAWLEDVLRDNKIKEVFILGDITDAKDRHPSALVNRLVGNLSYIATLAKVRIIKGNHDYTDINNPFMEFVNNIPNIEFYTTWNGVDINGSKVLFLPHAKNYGAEWAVIEFDDYDFIFIHQTIKGAVSSNGFELDEGINKNYFGQRPKVFAGDIHVPQDIGGITYVGAPYPIRYGDSFKGRSIILDLVSGRRSDLFFPTIKKDVLNIKCPSEIDAYDYSEGDRVKIRLSIKRADFCKWDKLRKECLDKLKNRGIYCGGIEMRELKRVPLNTTETVRSMHSVRAEDIFDVFGSKENIDNDTMQIGKDLLCTQKN